MVLLPLSSIAATQQTTPNLLARLQAGQSLQGRVVSSAGGQSVLAIAGGRLTLPVSLAAGQTVQVRITNNNSNSIEIIVQNQPAPQPSATPTSQDSPLARALVAAGLPVSDSLMQQLEAILGRPAEAQLPALALLLARGGPVSATLLNQLAAFVRQRSTLGPNVATLQHVLTGNAAGLPAAIAAPLLEALQRWAAAWDELDRDPREALGRLLREAGSGFESRLAAAAQGQTDLTQVLGELKALLLRARAHWQTSADPLAREAARAADGALDAMEQQRLASHSMESGVRRWWFQLPWTQDGITHTADLLLRQTHQEAQPDRNAGDGENTLAQVTLVVELSRLGPLRLDARLAQRRIDAALQCASPETAALLAAHREELAAALERNGLCLGQYAVEQVEQVEPLRWSEIFPEMQLPPRGGFDARA